LLPICTRMLQGRSAGAALAVLLLVGASDAAARQGDTTSTAPPAAAEPSPGPAATSAAVRASGPITLDGRLDEPAWAEALPVTDFLQFEPVEGAAPSRRTEVRVLLGEDGLYIGAHLYDEPGQVMATLGRRDELNQADWFIVSIDSQFDRRTAWVFGVNAAGVQLDAVRATGGGGGPGGGGGGGPTGVGDRSWNAIWSSEVRIVEDGWVAEIYIPYSQLRFPSLDVQSWGMHFSRRIPRLAEISEWPLVPRTDRTNLVSRFGPMEGITGVRPRTNLQVTPYMLSRLDSRESPVTPGRSTTSGDWDTGADMKVGLGSGFTLDLTLNPDFGQVESDPAELNLTAFETFFPERRPFFLEGQQIYNFPVGPGNLLYTRRIGAEAPIIGAAKLSGRTGGGLSAGFMGALTGDDFDPSRTFATARVSQEVGLDSSVGGILTFFDGPTRQGDVRATAGGVDWDLRLADNRYSFGGFGSLTHRTAAGGDAAAGGNSAIEGGSETGIAAFVRWTKREGVFTYQFIADVFQDTFNPNELGRITNTDFVTFVSRLTWQLGEGRPFGPFQRASVQFNSQQRWTYRERIHEGANPRVSFDWTTPAFRSYSLELGMENPFGGYEIYQTRGLGPRAGPRMVRAGFSFSTDERRDLTFRPDVNLRRWDDGGQRLNARLRADWTASPRVTLSADVSAERESGRVDWSSNEVFARDPDGWSIGPRSGTPNVSPNELVPIPGVEAELDAALAGVEPYPSGCAGDCPTYYFVPVFGARDVRSLDGTIRGSFTFTRNLDLSVFTQLFVARARYDDFQLLRDPDTLVPFAGYPKGNAFTRARFQLNAALRWEYRPGSTVYAVWTQGRVGDARLDPLAPAGPSPWDTRFPDQVSDVFGVHPDNVFMVKVSYAFLR